MKLLTVILLLLSINPHARDRLFPCSETMDSPYGICSHISRPGWDYECRDRNIALMKQLGISNVRTDFDFTPGEDRTSASFRIWDKVTRQCREYGIAMLPIITRPVNRERISDWRNDISEIVSRYDRIRNWEIINEPDIAFKNNGWPSDKEYSAILPLAYTAVKKSRPDASVLSGGFAQCQNDYFSDVLKSARKNAFDILNIHYYNAKQAPEVFWQYLRHIRNVMDLNNISCPVWLTETGYSTVGYGTGKEDFFNMTLPAALDQLDCPLSKVTVALVSDFEKGFAVPGDVLDEIIYKRIIYVSLDEIGDLDPQKVPVLIPTMDETFPMGYIHHLLSYVKRGGTIVFHGGSPLFYNHSLDGTGREEAVGDRYLADFHIGIRFPWTLNSKIKNIPKDSRYLLSSNLSENDVLIPLIMSEDGKNVISGIYRFDSDLKGNIIVNSEIGAKGISNRAQAERLPRIYLMSFAAGVEKVFWYHLRSFEKDPDDFESHLGIVHKDFSPKPSYHTYKTLVEMCPDKSTRPTLKITEDGVFVSEWIRPDGSTVTAVWTSGKKAGFDYKVDRRTVLYDAYGNPIESKKITASSNITYIVSR